MSAIPEKTKLQASSLFRDLADTYRRTFRTDPVPVLIQLPKGFQLYKWSGTSRLDASSGHRVRNTIFDQNGIASEFWAPWASMPAYDVPGFAELRKSYRNIDGGVGRPQELARARFAVTEEWSEMNSLVKSELISPAWAFLGVCSLQSFSTNKRDHRKGFFPGGDFQLLVPGLRAPDIFKL